jgi:hypothetical protein
MRTLSSLGWLALWALLGTPAHASLISYQLSGSTAFQPALNGVVIDVPIQGSATLDFDGARVSVVELELSFRDLAAPPFQVVFSGDLSVNGGAGLLDGGTLRFDQTSLASLLLDCKGGSLCSTFAPGSELGMRSLQEADPFLLNDFVFDAEGNFSTAQTFDDLLPIGVRSGSMLAALESSAEETGGGLSIRLRAVQVPEPAELGLLVFGVLGLVPSARMASGQRQRPHPMATCSEPIWNPRSTPEQLSLREV